MIYVCNEDHICGSRTWYGEIRLLVRSAFHYEAIVNSRGTYFHVIAGRYRNGNFLCVPNHNFGCELSQFTDTLWNAEKIRQYLNPTDTESLVCAIRALTKFNEDI